MRLGERCLEIGELRIGIIAQVGDRGLAVARQNIERIGHLIAARADLAVIGQRVWRLSSANRMAVSARQIFSRARVRKSLT